MVYTVSFLIAAIAFLASLTILAAQAARLKHEAAKLDAEKGKQHQINVCAPFGCQPMPISAQVFRVPSDILDQTVFLVRCKRCGAHGSKSLLGGWTIEQLLKTEADEAQLARMIGSAK
jgi:hypothetical protein